MACIRKRRGVWVVDHRDATGVRRYPSFATREEAENEADRLGVFRRRGRLRPSVDPRSTVAEYARHWLETIRPPVLKWQAYRAHLKAVENYLIPRLGTFRVTELRRSDVRAFLTGCQREGAAGRPLTRGSVRVIYSALRAMLNAAIDDELVSGNVAAKLGGRFKLQPTAHEQQAATAQRVLEPRERAALLEAARGDGDGEWLPLVLTYDRAGLRLNEATALEVSDIRFDARKIRVRQAIDGSTGALETPKHGPREVDLSPGLAEVLHAHISGLEEEAAAAGRALGRWLFPSEVGTPLDGGNVRRAFRRLSKAAGFSEPVTPQDLRHTFGSTLATRELPQYVQQQMGHRDINTTIRIYGSAFHARPRRGVALMDDGMLRVVRRANGCKVVAIGRGRTREVDVSDGKD